MKTLHQSKKKTNNVIGPNYFDHIWEQSWTYIRTVVDVAHEPILILNKDFCVMTANEAFYRCFQVEPAETEGKVIYELGNGQWDIPDLHKLFEKILPKNTFFRGFKVMHDFPSIGRKIMILNARHIHFKEDVPVEGFPPIIMVAIEDVTEMMEVAELLTKHTNDLEFKLSARTRALEIQIQRLEVEIERLNKKE
jgi:PAS domain-containing protein